MLDAGFTFPAARINGKDLIHQIAKLTGTGGETCLDGGCVLSEQSDIEHPKRKS